MVVSELPKSCRIRGGLEQSKSSGEWLRKKPRKELLAVPACTSWSEGRSPPAGLGSAALPAPGIAELWVHPLTWLHRKQEQLQSHSPSWDLVTLGTGNAIQVPGKKSHKSVTSSGPSSNPRPRQGHGKLWVLFANAAHQKFWFCLLLTHTEMLTGNMRSQERCQLSTGKRPRQIRVGQCT